MVRALLILGILGLVVVVWVVGAALRRGGPEPRGVPVKDGTRR